MRTALTIGILPDRSSRQIFGTEIPIDVQKAALKHRKIEGAEQYAEIQLWESRGIVKWYQPPVEAARTARRASFAPPVTVAPPVAPPVAPSADPYAAELAALTDPKLAEVADAFDVAIPAGATREQIIALILDRNASLEKTV